VKTPNVPEELTGKVTVIDATAHLPGDIILSTSTGLDSWLIRKATSSDVSHAALHIGHGIAIEANDPGVVPVFLPVLGHERAARLVVKRMPNLTAQRREEIVSSAIELLYRPYSTRGALSTRLTFLRKASDPGRFCSQLVAESYAALAQPICQLTPEESTPEDFLAATSLIDVEAGVNYQSTKPGLCLHHTGASTAVPSR
jgi:hypothetical protein